MVLGLALLIGMVAGLRALTPLAVVSWAAGLGVVRLDGTFIALLGYRWTPWILTLLALAELVTDQLPGTPSRKVPVQFGTRIVAGALCGAALTAGSSNLLVGGLIGAIGAILGTIGGAAVRARLAAAFGRDRPAALIEDGVAITAALLIVFG